jgi:hypothetical protein
MRYPRGTPYQGPTANYDRLRSPAENLSRLVYGVPRPLLAPRQRRDEEFYGRLLDELANNHAVLVKVCASGSYARAFCATLRKELPGELYEVRAKQDADDPRDDEWLVIAYNRVTRTMKEPGWIRSVTESPRPTHVNTAELCRILRLSRPQTIRLLDQYRIPYDVRGKRRERWIPRSEIGILLNRPRQWRTSKKKAKTP